MAPARGAQSAPAITAPLAMSAPAAAPASVGMSAKPDDGFYGHVQGRFAEVGEAGGLSGAATNPSPELEILANGKPAPPLIEITVSPSPSTISLRATDADGDAVTFSLWTAAAEAPIALADHGNGTATLTVSASSPGEHPFEVAVSDAHGEEWAPHILRIVSAAPTPQTPPTG